jgi:hypothetical protein
MKTPQFYWPVLTSSITQLEFDSLEVLTYLRHKIPAHLLELPQQCYVLRQTDAILLFRLANCASLAVASICGGSKLKQGV